MSKLQLTAAGLTAFLGLVVRLYVAQDVRWITDAVPVIALGQRFFSGGPFPLHGSLSSVGAYNMPLLEWLFMPAMLFTSDVGRIIVGTALILNLLSIVLVYLLAAELFGARIALLTGVLYTFATLSIGSSNSAWAQSVLCPFYTATVYFLFRWADGGRGVNVILAVAAATSAFMIHFSAVLLYIVIAGFYILARPRLSLRAAMAALLVAVALLAPYISFEVSRRFADVRAFITQTSLLPPEAIRPAATAGQAGSPASDERATQGAGSASVLLKARRAISSRLTAAAGKALGPLQNFRWAWALTETPPGTAFLRAALEAAAGMQSVLFLCGVAAAFYFAVRRLRPRRRREGSGPEESARPVGKQARWLNDTSAGRLLLLVWCFLIFVLGAFATGTYHRADFYWGLLGIQLIIVAYALSAGLSALRPRPRATTIVICAAALTIAVPQAVDYAWMTKFHKATGHESRYYDKKRLVDWIVADWQRASRVTVRYDVFQESNEKWLVRLHLVDAFYRIGMDFDYLLQAEHGVTNANTSADGRAGNPDYVVLYRCGLVRYELSGYEVRQFGHFYVLKPLANPRRARSGQGPPGPSTGMA